MKSQWKKYTALLIICLMLVGTFAVIPARADENDEMAEITFDVQIVQTNDIHARIEDDGESIGMDRLGGMIKSIREQVGTTDGPDTVLVLDAGDTFHGQSVSTIVKGESVARILKACGYDATTPGNHDWSYGKDRLKELSQIAGTTMLAGNVKDEAGTEFFDQAEYVKEIEKDGKTLKIGVFGVVDPQMGVKTTPSNVEGLAFTDPVDYAIKKAKSLRNAGCNIVIALSHTGDPVTLAGQVNGVDVWLCGHEHTGIDTSVVTPDGHTSYVSESGYYLYTVGLLDMKCTVNAEGTTKISYAKKTIDYQAAQTYEKDPAVTSLLATIKAENAEKLNQQVGSSPVELDGVWEHLRIGQTNLGNVVTDAYLQAAGANIAFENAGGIRASVAVGPVTYGDVIGISPYGNYIVTKKLTGKQLKEMLETSISIQLECIKANDSGDWDAWPNNSGSYLQIGGMTVIYDPEQPEGSRVLDMKVGDQKLDMNRKYTVAMNNYFAGSDTYPQLAQAEEAGEFSACEEALIAFFERGEDVIAASTSKNWMVKKKQEAETGDGSEIAWWIACLTVSSIATGATVYNIRKKKSY